jgi:hypothetical protein
MLVDPPAGRPDLVGADSITLRKAALANAAGEDRLS